MYRNEKSNYGYGGDERRERRNKFEGLRGMFAWEDETNEAWRNAVEAHGGGVPKFATKGECEDFVRKHCSPGSNPDFPNLQHIFTMLVTWTQIEEILIPAMKVADEKYPLQRHKDQHSRSDNRFVQTDVQKGIQRRMELPFHREYNRESTINTLKYLFFHMRCGIFVMIRSGRVVLFAPFVNKYYENNWADHLKFDSADGTFESYYREKRNNYRRENIIEDIRNWWANGNIICNEHCKDSRKQDETQYWGDQFLSQLRDMLDSSCKYRDIPDCEFFINKRDYPHLKNNLSEPYGFLFDRNDKDPSDDLPLNRHSYNTYAPIMSFYISNRFADIPFPCSEDWEAATGLVFPPSFIHTHCQRCDCGEPRSCRRNWECFCEGDRKYHGIASVRDLFTASNFKKFDKPWEDKINTAFFRGTATGGGTTIETNQRLHLAYLSNLWKTEPEYQHLVQNLPYLDAEITAWNLRDKKIAGRPMTFVRKDSFKGRGEFTAGKHHYIPMYEQSKFKYILYVEGHCAANRYAFLMRLGSVILKVSSKCVADEMWYTPLLVPMEDHVPIKEDLSDLAEKIEWCRQNDDKCRAMAERAKEKYEEFVSKEGIYDYIELITSSVAQRYNPAPTHFGYERPEEHYERDDRKPSLRPDRHHSCVPTKHNEQSRFCKSCIDNEVIYSKKRKAEQDADDHYRSLRPKTNNYQQRRHVVAKPQIQEERRCRKCRRIKRACETIQQNSIYTGQILMSWRQKRRRMTTGDKNSFGGSFSFHRSSNVAPMPNEMSAIVENSLESATRALSIQQTEGPIRRFSNQVVRKFTDILVGPTTNPIPIYSNTAIVPSHDDEKKEISMKSNRGNNKIRRLSAGVVEMISDVISPSITRNENGKIVRRFSIQDRFGSILNRNGPIDTFGFGNITNIGYDASYVDDNLQIIIDGRSIESLEFTKLLLEEFCKNIFKIY